MTQAHGQQTATGGAPLKVEGQQHPIGIYFKIWGLLFVLSAFSYAVDYFHFQGYLRWSLILLFMILKAGLIVSVFMHMMWERLAIIYAILLPPILVMIFVMIMTFEGDYTEITRGAFFASEKTEGVLPAQH